MNCRSILFPCQPKLYAKADPPSTKALCESGFSSICLRRLYRFCGMRLQSKLVSKPFLPVYINIYCTDHANSLQGVISIAFSTSIPALSLLFFRLLNWFASYRQRKSKN